MRFALDSARLFSAYYFSHMQQMNTALRMAIWQQRKSQVWLERQTGISQSRLSRIIHGHFKARASEKRALAKALRMSMRDLFPDHDSQAIA